MSNNGQPLPRWLKSREKSTTLGEGAAIFLNGQGLFYWDEETAADKSSRRHEELVPILRVATQGASVFLTIRYKRTGRTVASMRLSQEDGWLYYSVASAYYVKVYNEYNSDIKVDYNPYKGIELVNPNDHRYGDYV